MYQSNSGYKSFKNKLKFLFKTGGLDLKSCNLTNMV